MLYFVVVIYCSYFIRVVAVVAHVSHVALRPLDCLTDCNGNILIYGKKVQNTLYIYMHSLFSAKNSVDMFHDVFISLKNR